MQQCFEFGAMKCQKKRGIFIRLSITITYFIHKPITDIYWETVFVNIYSEAVF